MTTLIIASVALLCIQIPLAMFIGNGIKRMGQ